MSATHPWNKLLPHPKRALLDWDLVSHEYSLSHLTNQFKLISTLCHMPSFSKQPSADDYDYTAVLKWQPLFKQWLVDTKEPELCQENIPNIPPTPIWTVWCKFTWMVIGRLCHNTKIKANHTCQHVFWSPTGQFWWACMNCSLSSLFLADRSGT